MMEKAPGVAKGGRLSLAVAIAVVLIVAASVAGVVVVGARTAADKAVVHAGDGTVREFPLSQDGTFTVSTDKGVNVVEVRGGRVRVVDADCPNRDCVGQGWIDRVGQQIVCLPHELWVEVVPADDAGAADAADTANAANAASDAGDAGGSGFADPADPAGDSFDTVGS